jgi:RNA polymerase sigma factor (sigma-70 family)
LEVVGSTRSHARTGALAGVLLRTQPDERLTSLARNGSQAAFGEIVRRHRPALQAYATTVAPPSRADDVVQESLLKALTALRNGAEPELLRAWLFRIVRNTAIDEQRGVRHHEQIDENHDGVEQPPDALARGEQIAALVLAIKDLPRPQREAILQRELEGRGHREIGRALRLSPGAVRQLIYRARSSLREAAGAVIPVALVRAACMPGATEVAGGLGAAGAMKVGVAAVVTTGALVAGASVDRGGDLGTAKAVQPPTAHRQEAGAGSDAQDVSSRGKSDGRGSGSGSSGPSRHEGDESGDRGSSGKGSGGDHGSGGDDGSGSGMGGSGSSGSNSGPGSSNSGPGSGEQGGSRGSDDVAATETDHSGSGGGGLTPTETDGGGTSGGPN